MNKKVMLISAVAALVVGVSTPIIVVSSLKPVDEVLDANFKISNETQEVNYGEEVYLEPFSAKDKDGKWKDATISVSNSEGKEYEIKNFSFLPDQLGEYTVTYTIKFGKNDKGELTRSYKVLVKDLEAPSVSGFSKDNLVVLGSRVDLSSIIVEDNLDQEISPTIEVKFNNESVELTDNQFVADKEGTYVVIVTVKDTAGNENKETIYIHTNLNYEEGYVQENEWYYTEVSDQKSFNGDFSAKVHWLDTNLCWLNDGGTLGSDTTILSEDANYLSFWVYFDGEVADLNQLVIHNKYTYYDTKIYDKYGNELEKYYQYMVSDTESDLYKHYGDGKWVYEMSVNNWYRIVIDLKNCNNVCLYSDPKTDSTLEGIPNPETLTDLIFGFGLWDLATSGVPTTAIDTYIDDLKLTNDPTNEDYRIEYEVSNMPEEKIARIGDVIQLEATILPEGSDIVYSSSNPEVATVSEDGLVTCIKEGQADIYATCIDDSQKYAKTTVSVFAEETKMPDELNIIKVTGGKSYEGTLNMVEHQFWANNEYEQGICGCSSLFNMSIGHGTYSSFSPLNTDGNNLVSDVVDANGNKTQIINGWQAFMSVEDGIIFSFTAKEDMYIKVKPCDEGLNGWVAETVWNYVKVDTENNEEVLQTLTGPSAETITSEEWIEINEGEQFILAINALYDIRNIELLPWFEIAPAITSE